MLNSYQDGQETKQFPYILGQMNVTYRKFPIQLLENFLSTQQRVINPRYLEKIN